MAAVLGKNLLFTLFKNTADSTTAMKVNGAVTAVNFRVTAPAAYWYEIERLLFRIMDAAILIGKFGGLTALTNGLTIKYHDTDDAVLVDFMDGLTIKDQSDFGLIAGTDAPILATIGDDAAVVRWTIGKSGSPLVMKPGQYLQIKVQDDLTGLTKFETMAQGKRHTLVAMKGSSFDRQT